MAGDESSVRVAVRIRPQTPAEVVEGCGVCARAGGAAGEGGVALGSERAFTFDYAFEPAAAQREVYETCVCKLVEAALDGYNATVLAYGQTGSGKTYTMGSGWEGEGDGDEERRGIIPRAIRDLFAGADLRAEEARAKGQLPPEFSVQAQFIELYNEDIVDLLDPAKDPFAKGALRITEDGSGGVRIVGASMRAVRGVKEALGALRAGALARTTAATNMNSSSSRSHAVFTLLMRQRRLAADQDVQDRDAEADSPDQYETLTAKFHFVDLAGSERLKRTGATGDRAKEGISINCGLLALGNVISALGDKSRKALHVPYRDSKLTRLLQDSLGGNSNTVMIACISPSDRDFMETLNTLKYANRARNIKNRCVVNQDLSSRTIHQLRQELARLQMELAEYKQGKRVISESGEEGWSDVAQENAILAGEVEALRRRVKALQATAERLSARCAALAAEKALAAWAPGDGAAPDPGDCSLTALVQGYVSEIEDLRAQLMEANALYEASRRREQQVTRTRHDSVSDPTAILDGAKRELYKEKELLARSMGELELQRRLEMSDSMTSANLGERDASIGERGANVDERSADVGERGANVGERGANVGERGANVGEQDASIGERERAEGESADDSSPEDDDGEDDDDDSEVEVEDEETTGQRILSQQLAALSEDIDTKARLIEQLEASQRRLAALRQHYESRLDTLHHQIRATSDERDKVLASLASQTSPPSEKLKRVKEEYERRMSGMSRELRRLQAAQREHQRLQRSQQAAAQQLAALRGQLAGMKRDKVKLVQKMREDAKRHARAEAARAKEVAQLRKESRKNANLIRSLEAETKLKEQVLKRKQEEVSLLRRGHRDKLSSKAAGRLQVGGSRRSRSAQCRAAWSRLEGWWARASAARAAAAELEAALDALLRRRDAAARRREPRHSIQHLQAAIADTQAQIMNLGEDNDEAELSQLVEQIGSADVARYVAGQLAALALAQAADAARTRTQLAHAAASLRELEDNTERVATAMRAAEDQNLNPWGGAPDALAALFAHVSSGSCTRAVSPVDSSLLDIQRPTNGVREVCTAPSSPPDDNFVSPFQRNTGRRGSVRLRDLGVYGREDDDTGSGGANDPMTQSLVVEPPPRAAPLSRVPSAPGSLRGLVPLGGAQSPGSPRRVAESPRLPRRQPPPVPKPASLESNAASTPPASPGAARRARDDDVFLRLTGAQPDNSLRGSVTEMIPLKRGSGAGVGAGAGGGWLRCSHVCDGHAGAALSLAATPDLLFSGGVDRTVRGWDLRAGAEAWRNWCGGAVGALAAAAGRLLAAAGPAVRLHDPRAPQPLATLWSSGASGPNAAVRGGEVAVTALALYDDRLYTAAGDKLRLWDLRMMESVCKVWSGHAAAVMCLALSPSSSGDVLATGSKDHYVRTLDMMPQDSGGWEASNRRLLQPPHYDGVQALALAGDALYSASRDTSIKRWSLQHSAPTHSVMNAHKSWVTGLCAVGEGRLVSAGRDGSARLWDTALRPLAGPTSLGDAALALCAMPTPAHHPTTLCTAANGGEVRAWRVSLE